jgi:hypothetical protein
VKTTITKVWRNGTNWVAYAKHEESGAWIRQSGSARSQSAAQAVADELAEQLDREWVAKQEALA